MEATNEDTGAGVPIPEREGERLDELHSYNILDTLPEQAYDDITFLASQICGTPIALMSLVDDDRQWFKSRLGLDATETSRDVAFCAYAITTPTQLLIVPDATHDPRFEKNPLVTSDPSIRFYAGAPLVTKSGNALGTLCVIDRQPRELSDDQEQALAAMARQVMAQLELRRSVDDLERAAVERRRYQAQLEEYQRQLEANYARVAEKSVTDSLTGLKNRSAFNERLDEEIDRSRRHHAALSLALIDVDHFKDFNDAFGHPAGDAALVKVASLLEEAGRAHDLVARYGGEEFAVILVDTDARGAAVLAERCRRVVAEADWTHRPITVSIGLATFGERGNSAVSLIAAADEALYQAKEQGRNRVVIA